MYYVSWNESLSWGEVLNLAHQEVLQTHQPSKFCFVGMDVELGISFFSRFEGVYGSSYFILYPDGDLYFRGDLGEPKFLMNVRAHEVQQLGPAVPLVDGYFIESTKRIS